MFGTNHHFFFEGISETDREAVLDRLLFIPFDREITPRIEGSDKLLEQEYDYIATWAMEGLHRLVENGFVFTECDGSIVLLQEAKAQHNYKDYFLGYALKAEEGRYVSTIRLKNALKAFCEKIGIKFGGSGGVKPKEIIDYLVELGYPQNRVRIDNEGRKTSEGNPKSVLTGIRFRKSFLDDFKGKF